MKRFYIKLLVFAIITVAIDFGYGLWFDHFRRNAGKGMTRTDHVAAAETKAPILVVGSSRARRHYDTRIIADSLGAECFNCGYNSMGIEFIAPRIRQILNRYTPSLIIYDITPLYDLMVSDSWPVSLSNLMPHFSDPAVYDAIREADPEEWIKCHSATYRYHNKYQQIVDDQKTKDVFYNGYVPLRGKAKGEIKVARHDKMTVDPHKIAKLEQLIRECKSRGVDLLFVLSPYYQNDMGDQAAVLRPIASRHGIQVIDCFNDTTFTRADSLFWDQSHLNSRGATRFTRTVLSAIRDKHLYRPSGSSL